jgi:hypothetical protein
VKTVRNEENLSPRFAWAVALLLVAIPSASAVEAPDLEDPSKNLEDLERDVQISKALADALNAASEELEFVTGGDSGVAPGPLACPVGGCPAVPGTGFAVSGDCRWYQMYQIDAEVESGNGTVTARVSCGGDSVECTLDTKDVGKTACHAEFAEGPGKFVCEFIDRTGTIKAIGTCKDPANPWAAYTIVAEPHTGTPLPGL